MFNSSLNKKSKDILEGSTLVRPQDEFNSFSTAKLVDLLDHTKVFEYVNYDFNIFFCGRGLMKREISKHYV